LQEKYHENRTHLSNKCWEIYAF